jgi:hypothetical protein
VGVVKMTVKPLSEEDFYFEYCGSTCEDVPYVKQFNDYDFDQPEPEYVKIDRLKELFAELERRFTTQRWIIDKDGKLSEEKRMSRRWKDIEELFGPLVRK